ncbi:hypothetical protein ACHAXA_005880 [Cyclostephanos tholiformis]|uniref:WRKY19-like zinc finger domain-containing protein n=1 Tax=Cyclostephanos tholiformis TaxID=382380 RepID=A0ABD3SD41_9STRA
MDADRVHAYLQVACAGLGFDIGEVWWMSNDGGTSTVAAIEDGSGHESDSSGEDTFAINATVDNSKCRQKTPKKRFLQLYTSKAYYDQRSKLVQPHDDEDDARGGADYDDDGGGATSPSKSTSRELSVMRPGGNVAPPELDEEHVLSPRIVEAVMRSTQVVWANCQRTEGLLGRSDIRLQTAIGMPVGLDESGNVWVVVMFSPKNVESSTDAIDYLQYISRSAASVSIPCLLPVVGDGGRGGREGEGEGEGGATKMICNGEGIDNDREQHNQHYLVSIKPRTKLPDRTQELGEGVTAKFVSFKINDDYDDNSRMGDSQHDDEVGRGWRRRSSINDLRNAPKDDWGIPILPDSSTNSVELATGNGAPQCKRQHALSLGSSFDDVIENAISDAFDDASYGVWSTIMDSAVPSSDDSNKTPIVNNSGKTKVSENAIDDEMHSIRERLEEFATAFLGMSVFDVADAWTASSLSYGSSSNSNGDPTLNCLFTVAATNSNNEINDLMHVSWDAMIGAFDGAVGRAFSSGYPVWSSVKELIYDNSRRHALESCKIDTALAVPIFSAYDVSPSCVLCFYSLLPAESVPFVLNFVQKAVRLLWSGLDRVVNPHESVGKELWKGVGPADLGEMAADVEMQKAFIGKKRPRGLSFQEIKTERYRSMSMLTDIDYLSDVDSSSDILPNNAADIPLVSSAPTLAEGPSLFDTQPGNTDPFLSSTVLESMPRSPQFSFLNSDDDRHWAVQQAVRSVEETLWNGSHTHGVYQADLRPVNHTGNLVPSRQQQLQQPRQQQQPNHFLPQQIQQKQPPQEQDGHLHQYQLNHVIYDNVATQHQQYSPLKAMAYLPRGVHNDDISVIHANLMEFNAMAKMHSYDNSNNKSVSATSTNAANAEMATSINNDAYLNGVCNDSFGGLHTSNRPIQNQLSRHVNGTMTNITLDNTVPLPMAQTLAGPQQNMYCMTVARPISVQSMDPSLFVMDQKPCRIEGCNDLAVSKRPYCARHSGNRQCEKEGCTKCAQGATRFCIAHGGGRRCTYPGCDKGARDKYFCAAHGGGKRCKMDGCHKSAVGGSLYCTGHGGGKRCSVSGCDKSAQSSTNFCVKHGGGKKCQHDGCMKVARGKTLFCAAHGGGIRCKLAGCNRVAIGKAQRCRSHGGGADFFLNLDYEGVM